MSDQKVHYSSQTDNWETPQDLFDKLDNEFSFNVDLCSNGMGHSKCLTGVMDLESYIQSRHYRWHDSFFMNPPYSRGKQKKMVECAHYLFLAGKTVVCLLPARTDTVLFHKYIWDDKEHKTKPGVEMRLLKGRVKFELNGKAKDAAPFPSMVVVFKK